MTSGKHGFEVSFHRPRATTESGRVVRKAELMELTCSPLQSDDQSQQEAEKDDGAGAEFLWGFLLELFHFWPEKVTNSTRNVFIWIQILALTLLRSGEVSILFPVVSHPYCNPILRDFMVTSVAVVYPPSVI